jgi:hypothetical protein
MGLCWIWQWPRSSPQSAWIGNRQQNNLRGKSDKIVLIAFDLLHLNGYDLRKFPLVERKALLKKLIAKTAIQFSESFEVDGPEMFKHACGIGLEGVVSKVRDSRYNSGRGNDWVKKTCAQRETLPIASFALKESRFDGLYIGRIIRDNQLIYAGKIDHGFDKVTTKDLQARLKPLIRKTQPYAKKIARPPGHLGRAVITGRGRIPGEVCRGKGASPVLQEHSRGSMMAKDAFDRWWEWAEKPADGTLTIPAHLHDDGLCQTALTKLR